mmetsp:Transcript_69629/g.145468  ORF Transcript_69629/g.145468 Transcript_69629/m.145468 type:complete len:295 (-) Transcript_69629:472-1356(-)
MTEVLVDDGNNRQVAQDVDHGAGAVADELNSHDEAKGAVDGNTSNLQDHQRNRTTRRNRRGANRADKGSDASQQNLGNAKFHTLDGREPNRLEDEAHASPIHVDRGPERQSEISDFGTDAVLVGTLLGGGKSSQGRGHAQSHGQSRDAILVIAEGVAATTDDQQEWVDNEDLTSHGDPEAGQVENQGFACLFNVHADRSREDDGSDANGSQLHHSHECSRDDVIHLRQKLQGHGRRAVLLLVFDTDTEDNRSDDDRQQIALGSIVDHVFRGHALKNTKEGVDEGHVLHGAGVVF